MEVVIERGTFDSPDFLEKVESLTRALTPLADMAVLLDIDEMTLSDLIEDRTSAVSRLYRKTRAEIRLAYRQLNIELAQAGSPTGLESLQKFMADSEI